MTDVFISYARSTAKQAQAVVGALRALGHSVWIDDELPAHRAYTDVLEERLRSAKAVVVIWSAEAAKSHWVRAEANTALEAGTLVQLTVDGVMPPMPFNQIQCADMSGWTGDLAAPGWRKVVGSIGDLIGGTAASTPAPATQAPLAVPDKPSIAVLPFTNLSGDPEQEYFADGMVEEIATTLSRCRSIFVIGAGSGLSLKGKGVGAQEAAKVLGVRYVLEGSVRKAAGRVRIAVKLTDATDGAQIWADRFEDTLEDVFALQDRVALSVAGVIEPAVREADLRRSMARPTEVLGSYDLTLRAMARYRTLAREDLRVASLLLDRAIELDPNYGLALAAAAFCLTFEVLYGWSDDPAASHRRARELTERAITAAQNDANVLALAAAASMFTGGYSDAAALVKRGTDLNPGSSFGWLFTGVLSIMNDQCQLGMEQLHTSLCLDPFTPFEGEVLLWQGLGHFAQGQFADAAILVRQAIQRRPQWALTHAALGAILAQLGDLAAASEAVATYQAIVNAPDISVMGAAWPESHLRRLLVEGIAMAMSKNGDEAVE